MNTLVPVLWPELLLICTACVLFLIGISRSAFSRRLAASLAVASLVAVVVLECLQPNFASRFDWDSWHTLYVQGFTNYITILTAAIGIPLLLLAWPSRDDATGNSALDYGFDAAEFFALMLLSIAGVFLVAASNDIILLFLGIELASIPTYVMVAISRPIPVAQEAGVKYFFLGALAAAIMLFGFSYLYGATGQTHLDAISRTIRTGAADGGIPSLSPWIKLAIIMLLVGFSFKIAAVPMHMYAGDVYQGAATPVTAFLSFVPKASGLVAIIKILFMVGGRAWAVPDWLIDLMWVLAVLTMSIGNVLGLLQYNIKRVLAYSSIAHSGYMLVGLTALLAAHRLNGAESLGVQKMALMGVLFYLTAYGITNFGIFGVLMSLPGRDRAHGRGEEGSAETFEDIAGQGRRHVALGLAMTICCLSLTGIPLTVGFWGKFLIIKPALAANLANHSLMVWLVVITMVNAAVSAGYYLRIVATMFLRTESGIAPPTDAVDLSPTGIFLTAPLSLAIVLSVFGTLLVGVVPTAINSLTTRASQATLNTRSPLNLDEPAQTLTSAISVSSR